MHRTNDKGRLSSEEIERLVQEAEKYKAEDEAHKKKVDAKNQLGELRVQHEEHHQRREGQGQDQADDEEDRGRHRGDHQLADNNQLAEIDEFEDKQKELEGICNPIVSKLYQAAGGAPGGMPGGSGRHARHGGAGECPTWGSRPSGEPA